MPFSKVLIANRGEIACRVIESARDAGYRTVAVFSEADAGAPHVMLADQAVEIGPAPVAESYLKIDAIIAAAKRTGADAVHPGYGFLAENEDFAKACAAENITFIGPPAEAIRLMGNKRLSKIRMRDAGVPCVPGYDEEDQSNDRLIAEAANVGFPLMVKAAAGGGGRGMRLVNEGDDLAAAIDSARSEAENAFGSGELILERAVVEPRHVEIQVFADQQGNCVHLGERDCSIQRRHQKVVEEAPSPAVDETLRAKMGDAAVKAAQAVNYVGAGTVEFLLGKDGEFYFLEMNTRLQVEHPVTEEITGEDLVDWQLRVAQGDDLPLTQEEVTFNGHAIEVRLYAEDPYAGFLPQTGNIDAWRPSYDIRVDDGIVEGQEVSPFYDPMLAKMIAYGETREDARRKLIRGLEDSVLLGVRHNAKFLADVLAHSEFIDGEATTAFIGKHFPEENLTRPAPDARMLALAGVLVFEREARGRPGWRSSSPTRTKVELKVEDDRHLLFLSAAGAGHYVVEGAGDETIDIAVLEDFDGALRFDCDGMIDKAHYADDGENLHLSLNNVQVSFVEYTPQAAAAAGRPDDGRILAPMAGRIVAVKAAAGADVQKGDILVILEAMKMEHEIKAASDGVIEAISVNEGDQVTPRQLLATVQVTSAEAAE
jgi:geranyl-CoA carboxylase alpha subunit